MPVWSSKRCNWPERHSAVRSFYCMVIEISLVALSRDKRRVAWTWERRTCRNLVLLEFLSVPTWSLLDVDVQVTRDLDATGLGRATTHSWSSLSPQLKVTATRPIFFLSFEGVFLTFILVRVNTYIESVVGASLVMENAWNWSSREACGRRDDGASVSSGSGVSRRRVLSLGGFMVHNVCGYRSMELRWKMVFWNGLKLKFHRCIGQLRPSTSASSEDGLASYHRSHVPRVYARRLRARQAQR